MTSILGTSVQIDPAAASQLAFQTPPSILATVGLLWNTITVRRGVSGDEAWNAVVDLAARRFDIEVISKEDGYLRTGWSHSWTGSVSDFYKVRTIVKFNAAKTKVEVKSEAQFLSRGLLSPGWQMGTDERLTATMRTDIMGKVGRVTR